MNTIDTLKTDREINLELRDDVRFLISLFKSDQTCKTCKFFERDLLQEGNITSFGSCTNEKIRSDCTDSWLKRPVRTEKIIDGIMAGCDEERGYLEVGENFGCIHHQPK